MSIKWLQTVGLILVFVLPFDVLSQRSKIDSLNSLLIRTAQPEKPEILLTLAIEHFDNLDYKTAKFCAKEASRIATILEDHFYFVKSARIMATIFRRTNQIDSSLILLSEALPIAKTNSYLSETKYILNGLGICYIFTASYDQALKYYFELLEYPMDSTGITKKAVLLNIGLVFYKLKDFSKALNYYLDP